MIQKLQKSHNIMCTSRKYREVNKLAKIRKMKLFFVGKHGGSESYDKLTASIARMNQLSKIIKKFSPTIAVSLCSPEAARIAFGLGIYHITFSDSPHANAVMKLTIPLVQKLLIPWIIPKQEFTKYGISGKNIIQYHAIDAALIVKRKISQTQSIPYLNKNKKTILIRVPEVQAAYVAKNKTNINSIIKEITKEFTNYNIMILGRYSSQINSIKRIFGEKVRVLSTVVDGKILLKNVDVFIGSGGTMTAESALLGTPTISYNAVPNLVENYLVQKKLVKREANPKKIVGYVRKSLAESKSKSQLRAKKLLNNMEDPYVVLVNTMKSR